MGAAAAIPGDYTEPVLADGVQEIRISVYKLQITGSSFIDSFVAGASGAYHSGLVALGKEWAFGGHEELDETGVYCTRPEMNTDYTFYDRIVMGRVEMSAEVATSKMKSLSNSKKWTGPSYDLIEHNCNHFASDLCWMLMKKRPPDWINGTADTMALARRRKKAEQEALSVALQEYNREQAADYTRTTSSGAVGPLPGARAFEDAFIKAFDLSVKVGSQRLQRLLKECPENVDPQVLKRRVEQEGLDAAAAAAVAAARVAATAGRTAATSRATQPEAGLQAWDRCWQEQSAPLFRAWIQAAAAGELNSSDEGKRAEQVQTALAAAAAAAEAAAAEVAARAAEVVAAAAADAESAEVERIETATDQKAPFFKGEAPARLADDRTVGGTE